MLRDHKIIRISPTWISPARDSVPWSKLFDPVGIRIESSKVDVVETNCRRTKLVLLQGCRLLRMQTAGFVKCSSWYKPLCSVEEVLVPIWSSVCFSLFGGLFREHRSTTEVLEKWTLEALKTNTVANNSGSSLVWSCLIALLPLAKEETWVW